MNIQYAFLSIAVLAVSDPGCEVQRPPEATLKIDQEQLEGTRFKVAAVGEFRDDSAYGNKRRIYIITDTQTTKEYVGVSGVGISELGKHGKGISDER